MSDRADEIRSAAVGHCRLSRRPWDTLDAARTPRAHHRAEMSAAPWNDQSQGGPGPSKARQVDRSGDAHHVRIHPIAILSTLPSVGIAALCLLVTTAGPYFAGSKLFANLHSPEAIFLPT